MRYKNVCCAPLNLLPTTLSLSLSVSPPLYSQSLCISEPWKMSKKWEREKSLSLSLPLGMEIII